MEWYAHQTLEVVVAMDDTLPLSVRTQCFQSEVADEGGRWRKRKIVKTSIVAQIEKPTLALIAGGIRAVEVAVEDKARLGKVNLRLKAVFHRITQCSGPAVVTVIDLPL